MGKGMELRKNMADARVLRNLLRINLRPQLRKLVCNMPYAEL